MFVVHLLYFCFIVYFNYQVQNENIEKSEEENNDKLENKKTDEEEEFNDKSEQSNNEGEKENYILENSNEENEVENKIILEEKVEIDSINNINTDNNESIEKKSDNPINKCLETSSDIKNDTNSDINPSSSKVILIDDVNERLEDCKKEFELPKFEDSKLNNLKTTGNDNKSGSDVIDSCNDVTKKKILESSEESSNITTEISPHKEKSPKHTLNDDILHQPEVEHINNITQKDEKQNENMQDKYDKINPLPTETKPYQESLSSKFKDNSIETGSRIFNEPECDDFSKTDLTTPPVSSVNEKQFDNSMIPNEYCKPSSDSGLLSNVKQYEGEPLTNDYCKTDTVEQPSVKQYSEALMNEYRKLDILQPEINKQMYNKESVEFKNAQVLPVTTSSSQDVFKAGEQSKPKVSEKNYSNSIGTDHTITVPKYDNTKPEKLSKRTTPSPKTLPYRLPVEVPQVEKPRAHDYLAPMGFINYQKINNSIAMTHSDMPKASKDLYSDKKTDSVNMNMPKDKDVMNLPKSIDNSLLYSSVMQQSPYTDQSMMHLSLHHHLAHSSQYHHSPPVTAQPPVHQTKSRSKKSEQRRLAQQNQTLVSSSTQQPPSLPSHTQSYHHHHQTATYMMPQPSPSSPYHHSVIQHRMGQQSGSCTSADFYLSHSNQHAAAAAAQIASCNLSKLQQMTNGLDHHRRHITSPAPSPAASPANMTPPPPAASAAAAHLLQQSAVAYHKLYQQAGQTNQSRQYGHQSRGSPASPNVGLMPMQYGAPPPPFNGYRVAPQSTPPPSAASYMNQTTGQLQYTTHSQDPHQNSVYPTSAYNGSYLQPLNGSMHR